MQRDTKTWAGIMDAGREPLKIVSGCDHALAASVFERVEIFQVATGLETDAAKDGTTLRGVERDGGLLPALGAND